MPNKNYNNGVYKERKIVNKARKEGKLSFRSAGSKGKIDCCVIDIKNKTIVFSQCKPKDFSKKAKERLEKELDGLNDEFIVRFEVV